MVNLEKAEEGENLAYYFRKGKVRMTILKETRGVSVALDEAGELDHN